MLSHLLVEYCTDKNKILKSAFQSMQRIKLNCFDASPNFLVFGATSGGIYIFKGDHCEFQRLIPSKEGSATLVSISLDERHIGVATSQGLVLFIENYIEDSGLQYHVFRVHKGSCITCLKWHQNSLYIGDSKGIVSLINLDRGFDSALFQTKSLFQLPTNTLMNLESSIVQIDCFEDYLLISTERKTYLSNTDKEYFIQIGKKPRDGRFGACFLSNSSTDLGHNYTARQSGNNAFQSVNESEVPISMDRQDARIFCARPGARLWEAGFDAQVMCTYQFKDALKEKATTELFLISSEEEAVLHKRTCDGDINVDEFNFRTLQGISDKFILTYDSNRLYIFDMTTSKLAFWTDFPSDIKQVAIVKNSIYVWQENLDVINLLVVELENMLLSTLYRKQYYLCTDLCLKFKSELLERLEHSKTLYLLYALKDRIYDLELLEQLQPIFEKIAKTNQRIHIQKPNIVEVENLHLNHQEVNVQSFKKGDEVNNDLALILKQYKLNKTHSTIDIPDVVKLLESLDLKQMYDKLMQFKSFVMTQLGEDATNWCQLQCLKQVSERNLLTKELSKEIFEFLLEAVIKENSSIKYSCDCGYPLPKCHKYHPKFYTVVLALYETRQNIDQILRNIPYMWKHRVKTDVYGLNMTALIHYSNMELFKQYTLQLTYDSWHDILGYFVKINKGLCLNCGRSIDMDSLLTWSDVGKAVVQSLGAKNAIRILEKYENVIPNGALDATFYHTCIFTHTLENTGDYVKPEASVQFVNSLDRTGLEQFQDIICKYFKRKYTASRNPCYTFCPDNYLGVTCLICNLPLKNDILIECQTVKDCGHKFHKFCFDRGGRICILCE